MSRAARGGIRGTPARSSPTTTATIASSTMRCRTLRSPSRPRHRPEKNERGVMSLPLPGQARSPPPAPASELFLDPRGLARQIAQIVELGAAHAAAALDGDLADRRAVGLEHALDALAVRNLAHRERGVESAVAARDHDALVSLDTLTVALYHLDLHHHGVAGLEVRNLAGHALLLDFLDYPAHINHLDLGFQPRVRPEASASLLAPVWSSSSARRASGASCAFASRSGRRSTVRATACASRQRRMSAWSPDSSTGGTPRPSNTSGRV